MYQYEYPHPAVAADVAAFCQQNGRLMLLLIERGHYPDAGKWALPGGFINIDEDLEDAARRELEEETGLMVDKLEQLQAFGKPDRDPRERVISIVFTTVVKPEQMRVTAGDDAAKAEWFDVSHLPELAFDHPEIIRLACEKMSSKLKE